MNQFSPEFLARVDKAIMSVVIDQLRAGEPYMISMVVREPRTRYRRRGLRRVPYVERVDVEYPAIPASLNVYPEGVIITPSKRGDGWTWKFPGGQATFRRFIVYDRNGAKIQEGGVLNATPTEGSHIATQIRIGYEQFVRIWE